ncbi:hypothetical protein CKY13_15215 [Enterococcus hirae]|nr:hypothetical protein CKY13_15215 [Enterococcus hirae]
MWLKTLYRKRAVTWPFIFYTIIWTLSSDPYNIFWIYETIPTKALKYKLIVKNPITKLKKNQHYFLGDDKFEQLV